MDVKTNIKNMKIRNILYMMMLTIMSAFVYSSCDEGVNDWPVDPNYDGPFRTSIFAVQTRMATSVELRYTGVIDAKEYIFEFSEDSLEFNSIVKTVTILADTLTPYIQNSSPRKVEYRTWFEDLKGTTQYSSRMKTIDINGRETGYMAAAFMTPAEQILTKVSPGANKLTVEWDATKAASHITFAEYLGADIPIEPESVKTYTFSSSEIAEGKATIPDLKSGTTYVLSIYNNDALRGTMRYKTLGMNSGSVIDVPFDATAVSLKTLVEAEVAAGNTNVSLIFTSGITYEIGVFTVPAGITNLYFVGELATDGTLPNIFLPQVKFDAPITTIAFQAIHNDARKHSSNFFFDLGNANYPTNIAFENSIFENFGRSIVRLNNANAVYGAIRFSDCIINNIGSYGLANVGNATVQVGEMSWRRCTFTEIGDQFIDNRTAGITSFIIDQSTFYNNTTGLPKLFRFDREPGTVAITNTYFAGPNKNTDIKSGNGSAPYPFVDFTSCYITADFPVAPACPFTNAEILDWTSEEFFEDPVNGDFHLKEGIRFGGAGVIGDPRWR